MGSSYGHFSVGRKTSETTVFRDNLSELIVVKIINFRLFIDLFENITKHLGLQIETTILKLYPI